MSTDVASSADNLAQAARAMRYCKTVWDRFDCRVVTDRELTETQENCKRFRENMSQYYSFAWRLKQLEFVLCWIILHTRIATWGCLVGALISGTAAVIFAAIPMILLFRQLPTVLLGLAICFLLASSFMAGVLLWLTRTDLSERLNTLSSYLQTRRHNIDIFTRQLKECVNNLHLLHQAREAQDAYNAATEHYQRLVELRNSRCYKLKNSNWASLRSIAFEDFVAEIFIELGYSVVKTKASGDQGVDLVVRGKGRSIAVQTKGYSGSVGNKAVQEVFTGMTFYRCTECVVVTNSYFTSHAIELAHSVNCKLIDGQSIPQLIDGKIF